MRSSMKALVTLVASTTYAMKLENSEPVVKLFENIYCNVKDSETREMDGWEAHLDVDHEVHQSGL